MIVLNGYSLIYDKYHNKVTIYLPQTEHSLNSTVLPVSRNRRYDVGENELSALLPMAQMIFEGKKGECNDNE